MPSTVVIEVTAENWNNLNYFAWIEMWVAAKLPYSINYTIPLNLKTCIQVLFGRFNATENENFRVLQWSQFKQYARDLNFHYAVLK